VTWQHSPFVPVLVVTALACGALVLVLWRQRSATGAGIALASFVATAAWNAGYALELSSANYEAQLFWANVQYIFISQTPSLMFAFALTYTGRGAWLSRPVVLALCIQPLTTIVLAFASETLPWLRTGGEQLLVDGSVVVAWHYGSYFWLHTAYSYVLLAAATAMLIPVVVRSPHLYRLQTATVIVGILAPWIANAIYVLDLSPFPYLDLTPFSFFIFALAIAWALTRLRFFDVVPIARESVVEGLHDAVLVIGLNDRIADANPAAASLFGESVGDLVGRPLTDLPPSVSAALTAEGPLPARSEVELPVDAGVSRVLELRLADVLDHRQRLRGRIALFHDVTQRKVAEEERVRSQRLLAAGELAAGVAHNLNNILVGILAPARRLEAGDSVQLERDAGIIVAAAERARDLVLRLQRGGAGEEVVAVADVDLAEVTCEAVQASRPRWEGRPPTSAVTVTLDVDGVPLVRVDRTGLHDVLLNLILNGVDAMPDGGELRLDAATENGAVLLTVTDEGHGMDAETVRRVFEPFFTTKVDVGMGLGLTTAHRSLRRWGGDITVDSTPGVGTTFRVRLPIASRSAPASGEEAGTDPKSSVPRVLVAEDEAIVSMVIEEAARKLGCDVEVVHDGREALERLRAGGIDVAVVDLGLPGLAGNEVAARARQAQPSLTTVMMSGWSLQEGDERLAPFDDVLAKPFDHRQAERVLQRAIERSVGGSSS
jgi:PAS domain S-box-containing protein